VRIREKKCIIESRIGPYQGVISSMNKKIKKKKNSLMQSLPCLPPKFLYQYFILLRSPLDLFWRFSMYTRSSSVPVLMHNSQIIQILVWKISYAIFACPATKVLISIFHSTPPKLARPIWEVFGVYVWFFCPRFVQNSQILAWKNLLCNFCLLAT